MNQRDTMVRDVSRTFALSIEVLPPSLRESVGIAYLLLRISDGIEDHDEMSAERKAALLDLWANILIGKADPALLISETADLDSDDPEVTIIHQTQLILDWLHALPEEMQETIVHHVYDTTCGMARWQRHGPYVKDEEELDDYMHEVAGRVGYLVTDLFAMYSRKLPTSTTCSCRCPVSAVWHYRPSTSFAGYVRIMTVIGCLFPNPTWSKSA
ncbi:MAG: squalene/phytoene synthase family protein [Chloroflexota bacterium]